MKQWTVYFRDKNGSKASVVIEAEDRSGVFAELKKRGISAISVSERASNKKPRKAASRGAPSKGRGLFAAALLVLLAGVAVWFMWPEEKMVVEKEVKQNKKEVIESERVLNSNLSQIDKPIQSKSVQKIDLKKRGVDMWDRPPPSDLDEESQEAWKRRVAYEKKLATDKRLQRYLKSAKPKTSLYKTGTEQVLDWIFYTKVGDHPPPPLPQVSQFELNHIDEILDSVNEIKDDDDEVMVERKKIVDEVKKELKKYLSEGGTVQGFLEYYRDELVAAYKIKGVVASEINKEINEGANAEKSLAFIENANKTLEEKGIPAVELTEDQKDILVERFNKDEKK